jgi:NAD-dependent dihydropyrimidine dehydrogenase PreA subunit
MSTFIYLRDVVTLSLDSSKCTGCGTCLQVCPHEVLARQNGTVIISDRDACMECGACAKNCPAEAISVTAGVGCAMAVINTALGRTGSSCCCVVDSPGAGSGCAEDATKSGGTGCC